MNEKSLTLISISISFVGVVLMILISQIEPERVLIKDLDETDVGKFVTLNGIVSSPSTYNGNTFFSLSQNGNKIKSVSFGRELFLKNDDSVTLKGEIVLYKGELEIIVDEITLDYGDPE